MFRRNYFDTITSTKKSVVSIVKKFILHSYVNKNGESQVMLRISQNGVDRIGLKIYGRKSLWNNSTQSFKEIDEEHRDKNILLKHLDSRANNIIVESRLNNVALDRATFRRRFESDLYSDDFIQFMRAALEIEKPEITKGTYDRYVSLANKLESMYETIPINSIDVHFIDNLRSDLYKLGNKSSTIAANLNGVKKYLNVASRYGFRLRIDPREIRSGSTRGKKTALNQQEIALLIEYYESKFIPTDHKLILGYFLCGCYFGLRFADLMNLDRDDLLSRELYYTPQKTIRHNNQPKRLIVSDNAFEIIKACPDLFDKKLTNQYINREIKKIVKHVNIDKTVTFHTSRHTFATSFLRAGGDIHNLQILLDHSTIEQTMEYVHITEQEAASALNIMDQAF